MQIFNSVFNKLLKNVFEAAAARKKDEEAKSIP